MGVRLKDWKLLCSVVCSDLDQPGYPETVCVLQLVSATGPELYRVVGDRFYQCLAAINLCLHRGRRIEKSAVPAKS